MPELQPGVGTASSQSSTNGLLYSLEEDNTEAEPLKWVSAQRLLEPYELASVYESRIDR